MSYANGWVTPVIAILPLDETYLGVKYRSNGANSDRIEEIVNYFPGLEETVSGKIVLARNADDVVWVDADYMERLLAERLSRTALAVAFHRGDQEYQVVVVREGSPVWPGQTIKL